MKRRDTKTELIEELTVWDEARNLPVLAGDERVIRQQGGVAMYVGTNDDAAAAAAAARCEGRGGVLLVTDRRCVWADVRGHTGRAVGWRCVALHAVSRDSAASGYPPHMYLQLDDGTEEGDDDDDDSEHVKEIRLVPDDATCLEDLFASMCEAAALNPDATDDEADEGAMFADADEEAETATTTATTEMK
jgi:nucleotide-sensitive chloride channel 1A